MHFLLLLPGVVLLFFALVELSLSATSLASEQNGPFGRAILPSTGPDLLVNVIGPYFIFTLLGLSRLILLFKRGHSTMATSYVLPFPYRGLIRALWALFSIFNLCPFFLGLCLGRIYLIPLLFGSFDYNPIAFSLLILYLVLWASFGFSPHWAFRHELTKTCISRSIIK